MNLSLLPVRPGQFSSRLGPQSCHRFEYKLLCLHLCHDCFRMVRQRARGLSTTPLHEACAPTRSSQLSSYRCWQGCRVDSAVTLCRRRGIRLALCLLSCPCLSAPRHCAGSRNQHLLRVVSPWTSLRPAQSCPPVLFGVAPPISAGMYTRHLALAGRRWYVDNSAGLFWCVTLALAFTLAFVLALSLALSLVLSRGSRSNRSIIGQGCT